MSVSFVTVTEQSPAASLLNSPEVIEQPVPETEYEMLPVPEPPLNASVMVAPYVPEVEVNVSEDCIAFANVTVVADDDTAL